MAILQQRPEIFRLIRYYQAAIVNTAFGISVYSLFVFLGMQMFVAQICSHILGSMFNYFTYSKHAFASSAPSKLRFMISYGFNYLMSLAALAGMNHFLHNPYTSGICATFLVSLINFFILKNFVFTKLAS